MLDKPSPFTNISIPNPLKQAKRTPTINSSTSITYRPKSRNSSNRKEKKKFFMLKKANKTETKN